MEWNVICFDEVDLINEYVKKFIFDVFEGIVVVVKR